jgi:type I restriction enzyme S subunit
LEEQRSIVDILIAIDRKIEVNKRINDNLEQQAEALYRSWFVDFEPFKDGKFIDSELGLIPEGWRVGELYEITNITSGKRPSTKSDYPTSRDKVPVFGASGIMAYTTDKLYDIPILIIGRVGTLGIVQKIDAESWPSDNTLVILSKNYHFVYFNLKSIDYQAINRGSTQPLITQSDIKQQMILIPQDEVLMKFEEKANILDKAIKNNDKAIKRLVLLRDTLLPKLMSGKLNINEIDC